MLKHLPRTDLMFSNSYSEETWQETASFYWMILVAAVSMLVSFSLQ